MILEKIGFAWKPDADHNFNRNDKLWHQHYETLVEFKGKKGHCIVPRNYEEDKPLGVWVNKQRSNHKNNKLRPDRKELLDAIGFAWKAVTLPAPSSSTTDVRILVIGLSHALGSSCFSHSFFSPYLRVAIGFGSLHQQCESSI
jgi:hypothetical protein